MSCFDDEPLAGAWAKLRRATAHARQLAVAMNEFCQGEPAPMYVFRKEVTAERGQLCLVMARVRSFPDDWALMVGDVLSNSRTALDHLAWLLVKRGGEPAPSREWRVQFPICVTDDEFDKAVPDRLPGVGERCIQKIRNRQPIADKPYFETFECLADLVSLVNTDKHRELHPVVGQQTGSAATLLWATDFEVSGIRYTSDSAPLPVILSPGKELIVVEGSVTGPDPDVELRLQGAVTPAFEDGRPVQPLLANILRAVGQLLATFDGELSRPAT
jgi:hypothetical protein